AVDLGAELDLLDDRVDLVLPRLTGLHGGFVLVLAEVHELGDRWARHRSHLDQVEIGFGGQAQRVFDAHDPDLLTVWANQPHFRDPDAVVDSRLADCLLLRSCQWTPRNEERPLVTVHERPECRHQEVCRSVASAATSPLRAAVQLTRQPWKVDAGGSSEPHLHDVPECWRTSEHLDGPILAGSGAAVRITRLRC